jgi:hypothetical protein
MPHQNRFHIPALGTSVNGARETLNALLELLEVSAKGDDTKLLIGGVEFNEDPKLLVVALAKAVFEVETDHYFDEIVERMKSALEMS